MKKNNTSKNSGHETFKVNAERIFIDTSSVKEKDYGPPVQPKQHWSIMVDERTNLKFTKLFTTNNGIIEPTLEQIEKRKNNGLVVKHIQLDNSGENKKETRIGK